MHLIGYGIPKQNCCVFSSRVFRSLEYAGEVMEESSSVYRNAGTLPFVSWTEVLAVRWIGARSASLASE